jgi:hypothetical protein
MIWRGIKVETKFDGVGKISKIGKIGVSGFVPRILEELLKFGGALNCWWISDWSLMIGSLAKRSTGMSSKRTLSEIRRTNSFQILNSDVTMR